MRRSLAATAVACAAAILAGCSSEEPPQIETVAVARATVAEVVEAPGTVTAKATATVSAPADGRVSRLSVSDGGRVRAGQLLVVIDSPTARDNLAQAEEADRDAADAGQVQLPGMSLTSQQEEADSAAERGFATARKAASIIPDVTARAQALAAVTTAESQYRAAQADARAAVRRFNQGLGSVAEALGSLAQAQRVQTRAAVALARRTVDALTIRAPITGVVSFGAGSADGGDGLGDALDSLPESVRSRAGAALGGSTGGGGVQGTLAQGGLVRSGQQLLTVTDVSTVAVSAEVDETDVLLVRPGIGAEVELDAVPGASYAAKVAAVGVAPTTSGRGGVSYVVRLTLGGGNDANGDPAPAPRPGMSAVVDLRVRTARNAVSVPASAVFRDGTRDAVWTIGADSRARKQVVALGAQGETLVEVREGLRVGQRVVARGADKVTTGQQVP